ncbi:MAG: thiol-disulfide oxidoreductase DCC family protein [Chthoniobacterales bacterium]
MDAECELCNRVRQWLQEQPVFVELYFIPLQSSDIGKRFPGIEKLDLRAELVVISDEGAVYQGTSAWIMCLYALREYRVWSQRLAQPFLAPLARRVCEVISNNRIGLSRWLLKAAPNEIREKIEAMPAPLCEGETCRRSLFQAARVI